MLKIAEIPRSLLIIACLAIIIVKKKIQISLEFEHFPLSIKYRDLQ